MPRVLFLFPAHCSPYTPCYSWYHREEKFSKRISAVLGEIRKRAADYTDADGKVLIKKEDWSQYKLRIVSHNNFPTAAGLASSASGYACLAKCLAAVHGMKETFDGELSAIARQGSGSASRSLYGGFVKWEMGQKDDGSDSYAIQVAPEEYWEDMRVLILVVNAGKKGVSSTSGMQTSVETSPLMKYRADVVVPQRMKDMEAAIQARDFEKFAELTMADSNQFHACCLDTLPPIFYMNDTSKRIVSMVHTLNATAGETKAAYTFDAGPNAVIYLRKQDLDSVLNTFLHYFQTEETDLSTYVLSLVADCFVFPLHTRFRFSFVAFAASH